MIKFKFSVELDFWTVLGVLSFCLALASFIISVS
jgi:hypothetical protein